LFNEEYSLEGKTKIIEVDGKRFLVMPEDAKEQVDNGYFAPDREMEDDEEAKDSDL